MTEAIRPSAQKHVVHVSAAIVQLNPTQQSILADNVADCVSAAENPARPSKPVDPGAQVALIAAHLAEELGLSLSVAQRGPHTFAVAIGGAALGVVSTEDASSHRETFNANVIQQFAALLVVPSA